MKSQYSATLGGTYVFGTIMLRAMLRSPQNVSTSRLLHRRSWYRTGEPFQRVEGVFTVGAYLQPSSCIHSDRVIVRYDPQVGYCQGLPFIVAILLLNASVFAGGQGFSR